MNADLDRRTRVTALVNQRNAALAKMREGVDSLTRGYKQAMDAVELEKPVYVGLNEMRVRGSEGLLVDETNPTRAQIPTSPGMGVHLNTRTQQEAYSQLFAHFDGERSFGVYRQALDTRIWLHLVETMGVLDMMDRTAKDKFYKDLAEDVPEFTEENVYSMFSNLMGDAKLIFQRGVARAFGELDRRFKSHNQFAFKNRIILNRLFNEWGSWNWGGRTGDTLADIERVFAVLDRQIPDPHALREAIEKDRIGGFDPRRSVTETRYFRVCAYKNGNAHLWFKRQDLVEKVNDVLAEYYGEVLPDAAPYDPKDPQNVDLHSTTQAISTKLQFYPTPDAVTDIILQELGERNFEMTVLEPSAGTGNMVRRLLDKTQAKHITAVEVHPDRASLIPHSDRTAVICGNFMAMPATPTFECVVMNPPFHGTHWMEHVVHAWDFLVPGGLLFSVLPVTAETGESKKHHAFRTWAEKYKRHYQTFRDLPPESFLSSGTRINTVLLYLRKPF